MPDTANVAGFWDWFSTNTRRIKDAYCSEDYIWLDGQIAPRLARIAERLNWEIGPYHAPDDTFVLSPTIRENLPITRAAIRAAPKLDGWRFLPAKPPKELISLTFAIGACTVNADDWKYRLTAYNGREFVDIDVFVPITTSFSAAQANTFCELVVEALLGEETRLDRVGCVIPNIVAEDPVIENTTPMRYLREHLARVLAPIGSERTICRFGLPEQ